VRANNNIEENDMENEKKEKMSNGEKQKDRAQVFNPVTGRWVKIDTKHGGIVQHKKTPGKFENVRILRKKKKR